MAELLQRLQARLKSLPDGLQAHIYRVRDVALELAALHDIDPGRAEIGALAHDVCRAVPEDELVKMSAELGVPVTDVADAFLRAGETEARLDVLEEKEDPCILLIVQ